MPVKKVRKIGGMPWWYIRKKIVVPTILLTALVIISLSLFLFFKSKRLSYIPRAEGEMGCQISENVFVPIGEKAPNSNFICCRNNKIYEYPHLEEDKCSSEVAEPANTEIQTNREDVTISPAQESENKESDSKTPVQNINLNENKGTVRIMLLGDSLIGGGGVPQALKDRIAEKFPEMDFLLVGSQSTGDVPHEGHGSFTTSDIARDLEDGQWNEYNGTTSPVRLNELNPDLVIVQLGTNNISSGFGYDKKSYERIFTGLRKVNPQVKIIVSKVPFMFDTNRWSIRFSWEIEEYNKKLQAEMEGLSTAISPVILTGSSNFVATDVSVDGVHPAYRGGGEEKLVTNYVNSL